MWRCLNDAFGYCSEEPEIAKEKAVASNDPSIVFNVCLLDPATCGKHQLLSDQIDPEKLEALAGTYRQVIVATPAGEPEKKVKVPTAGKKQTTKRKVQEEQLF